VSGTHLARRQRASRIPEITAVRLTPTGGNVSLVNISSSGLLVECGVRLASKTTVTVRFEGTFSPASIEGQVARCQVAGIGKDGAIRYHVGIAFAQHIALNINEAPPPSADLAQPAPPEPPQAFVPPPPVVPEAVPAPASSPVAAPRNRW
jgi:hypothetical protein